MQKLATMLWFDNQAEKVGKFYESVFKDSKIVTTQRNPENNNVLTVKLGTNIISGAR